jgi:hypothetical protein
MTDKARSEQWLDDVTAISAFLAMARKHSLMLNGHTADEVWQAWARCSGWNAELAGAIADELVGDNDAGT